VQFGIDNGLQRRNGVNQLCRGRGDGGQKGSPMQGGTCGSASATHRVISCVPGRVKKGVRGGKVWVERWYVLMLVWGHIVP
jgi:hypothetical protein